MEKRRLLTIKEAQKLMGCTLNNIWQAVRRLSLKAVKRNNRLYTCQEWIEEYYENWHSKQEHSCYNGRKVFDDAKGEMSRRMVADELGVHPTLVTYYIRTGKLKATKKGHYDLISRKDYEAFREGYIIPEGVREA